MAHNSFPVQTLVLNPIENAELVDERRHSVGLPPMADYEKKLREVYK